MKITIKGFKNNDIIWLLLYKIVYEIIYYIGISEIFGYVGFIWEPNIYKGVLSYALLIIAYIIGGRNKIIPSKFLVDVILVFIMIPLLSFYWVSNQLTSYVLMCMFCFCLLKISCAKIETKFFYSVKFKMLEISRVEDVVFIVIIIISCIFVIKYGFADLRAIKLENVYEIRGERKYVGIWGYAINWVSYALLPCLFCISVYNKRKSYVIMSVVFQVYYFFFTGSKTVLFSIGLIGFSYYLIKTRLGFVKMWCLVLSTLSVVDMFIYNKFGILMPFGIIPSRLLATPAYISYKYYNFFIKNPRLYFSENFIGRLLGIQSPYEKPISYIISGTASNANTGFMGDAYGNGGFFVMILYTVILSLVLRYINGIYIKKNTSESLPVFVAILTYSMVYLVDGSLTSLFLTGGLIINIVVLGLIIKREEKKLVLFSEMYLYRYRG